MSKCHALAGVIGQRETSIIAAVVDEITAKPAEQVGLKLMPVKAYPEHLIYHEKVSGFGGLLGERLVGEEGQTSAASSSVTYEFSPGAYQEAKRFSEKDLIQLKRLGSMGERGATGISSGALDYMSRAAMDLKFKLDNRLNKLAWDTIFTGKYTYQGVTKYDFAPPVSNTIQAGTDWSVVSTSTPFTDLYNILMTNPTVYKYIIKEIMISPVTAAAMLNSAQARSIITNNAQAVGDINKLGQILYPGLPTITVVKDAWQDQTVVAGQIVNQQAQYFVPDYKLLLIPEFGGTLFGQYGEISMTYNINDPSATVERPALGIYTFVDEAGLLKRKAPHVEIVTGFNGGANLLRSNDVLIVKAKAGI
jgi:hypothetical protein